jgi:hypothetical protein
MHCFFDPGRFSDSSLFWQEEERTSLIEAAQDGHEAVVRLLIEHKAGLNHVDSVLRTHALANRHAMISLTHHFISRPHTLSILDSFYRPPPAPHSLFVP